MKFAYFLGGPNDLTKMVIHDNDIKDDFWFPTLTAMEWSPNIDERLDRDIHIAHYRLIEDYYDGETTYIIYLFDGIEHV